MSKTPNQEPPTLHSILDTGHDHSTSALYRSALGDLWNNVYLKHFASMEEHPKPHWRWLGWNWAAAGLTTNWLIYRGMWRGVLTYISTLLALCLLVLGMGRLAYHLDDTELLIALGVVVVLISVFMGLAGNALLYWSTRKQLQKALTVTTSLAEANEWLRRHAPSRKRLYIVASANAALLVVCLLSWLQMPLLEGIPTTASTPAANVVNPPAPTTKTPAAAPLPTAAPSAPPSAVSPPPSPTTPPTSATAPVTPVQTAPSPVTPPPAAGTPASAPPSSPASPSDTAQRPSAPRNNTAAATNRPTARPNTDTSDRPALVSEAARQARERVQRLNTDTP
ncbi:DUF2628 domain-containing protein [Curvibacter sp. CHRR-16]|uniref:DUF2628 domain-containing protein n=1 Tax=Curvibacter sp. CHRR-16 TaxID=2835872 RepID=UPI001BD967CB|nr:DUF2628 domain-containing protein [Curvibacter sp. CHRR-16]MBT0568895.1 DUF2628 domain-containing protein [Curvibacter sp. CHRR-16]